MFTSRKIDDLATPVKIRAFQFLAEARLQLAPLGIDVIVSCTVRDAAAQNELYAQGRTREQLDAVGLTHVQPKPGRIVTNAYGGKSFHQYFCAFDILLVQHGKVLDDNTPAGKELWLRVGLLGEAAGLQWAGRWTGRLREECHFQYTGGITLAGFESGQRLENGAVA